MSFNHPIPNIEGMWIPKPDNRHTLISNPSADASLYKPVDGQDTGIHCITKSCDKFPQTVCLGCQEYVCEDHLFRHPDCEEGK